MTTKAPFPANIHTPDICDVREMLYIFRENVSRGQPQMINAVRKYVIDDGFAVLAGSTQRSYVGTLANLFNALGYSSARNPELPFDQLAASKALESIKINCGPSSAELAKRAANIAWKWAVSKGHFHPSATNYFMSASMPKRVKAGPEPWPEDVIERAIKDGSNLTSTLVMLMYDTGQRFGDAINIRFDNIERSDLFPDIWLLRMTQQKTGATINMRVSQRLVDRVESLRPLSGHREEVVMAAARMDVPNTRASESTIRTRVRRNLEDLKLTQADGSPLRMHGIRKSATVRMLDAGATTHEVMGVTGHKTAAMVDHYGKRFSRAAAATRAMDKVASYEEQRAKGRK